MGKYHKFYRKIFIILFWLTLWHVCSMFVSQDLFLVSPIKVFFRLTTLIIEKEFWFSIFNSLLKIFLGFALAVICGILLAAASYKFPFVHEFLSPVISTINATPVVSFTLLMLLWINENYLSTAVSFLMVIPIIYFNIYNGLMHTETKLLEMAKIFQFSIIKKVRAIYFFSVMPYFLSAISIGLGFAFKSGIAVEVIGLVKNTIGNHLYESKIYMETVDLFAWTVVIVILSVSIQKIISLNKWEGYKK